MSERWKGGEFRRADGSDKTPITSLDTDDGYDARHR
jgi:hypothetical protein